MANYSVRHSKNTIEHNMWTDGIFLIGLISGFFIFALLIIVLFFFAEFDRHLSIELAPIVVSLLVAGASTFLATKALLEQKKTREAATDPVLVAHFGHRRDARELITFNISNIGAGAALEVQISSSSPEAKNFYDGRVLTNIFEPFHPISIIKQDQTVEYNFGMVNGVLGPNPIPPFKVHLQYKDLVGHQYQGTFILDVRELAKIGIHPTPEMRIVAALEQIAKK